MDEWQKPETITLWIIIIGALLILLLTFIFFLVKTILRKIIRTKVAESNAKLKHQQDLIETAIKTQEKERKRIAEDIHDALIGKLMGIQIEKQINNPDSKTISLIRECIDLARRISHDLSPPLLEYTSLPILIDELLDPWKKIIAIVLKNDIRYNYNHSNDFKIQLTRIIQEMLTNITKHANATEINLSFRQTNKGLAIQIKDNGKGFLLTENKNGLGLKNIETRVQYLRGRYRMTSKINHGTSTLFLFKPINTIVK